MEVCVWGGYRGACPVFKQEGEVVGRDWPGDGCCVDSFCPWPTRHGVKQWSGGQTVSLKGQAVQRTEDQPKAQTDENLSWAAKRGSVEPTEIQLALADLLHFVIILTWFFFVSQLLCDLLLNTSLKSTSYVCIHFILYIFHFLCSSVSRPMYFTPHPLRWSCTNTRSTAYR